MEFYALNVCSCNSRGQPPTGVLAVDSTKVIIPKSKEQKTNLLLGMLYDVRLFSIMAVFVQWITRFSCEFSSMASLPSLLVES